MSDDLYELDPDYTPAERAQGNRIGFGCAVLVICGIALGIGTAIVPATAPAEPSPVAATVTPAPTAPPCIHEVCGDRPARLRCNHWSVSSCDVFDIHYERHYTCDTWGTVAADGGAP